MPEVKLSSNAYRACRGCRQRRTRCDRKQPCTTCQKHSIECVQECYPRQSKAELRREKAELQAQQDNASIVLDSLARDKQTEFIMQLLRSGTSLEDIVKGLDSSQEVSRNSPNDESTHRGQVLQQPSSISANDSRLDDSMAIASSLATTMDERKLALDTSGAHEYPATHATKISPQFEPAFSNTESQDREGTRPTLDYGPKSTAWINSSQWQSLGVTSPVIDTSDGCSLVDQSILSDISTASSQSSCGVSSIPENIQESPICDTSWTRSVKLMTLPCKLVLDFTAAFFTWKDLPFPAIRRALFVSDLLTSKFDHCSPALIRSISCLGCRALGGHDPSQSTYANLGNRLFDESCLLLAQGLENTPCVPDVQALGLLALHQLGVGLYADAIKLGDEGARRMAIIVGEEVKLSGGHDSFRSSTQTEALCSAVSLARFIRLLTSYITSQEQISMTPSNIVQSCLGWTDGPPVIEEALYVDGLLSTQLPQEDTCGAILIYRLIDYLYHVSPESGPIQEEQLPNTLVNKYHAFLAWYDTAMKQQQDFLFLHLVYHFCLLVLFRPFFLVVPPSGISPASICRESCKTILSLTESGNNQGACVQSVCLIPLFILAAGGTNL